MDRPNTSGMIFPDIAADVLYDTIGHYDTIGGLFCGRPCDMELVTRQYERPGHQQRLLQTFTDCLLYTSDAADE